MRFWICLLILMASVEMGYAQVGKIGMKVDHLKEQLGEPVDISHSDDDQIWIYKGRDDRSTFAYHVQEGTIVSRNALIKHTSLNEARAYMDDFVATLEDQGWRSQATSALGVQLQAGNTLVKGEVLAHNQEPVVLIQHIWQEHTDADEKNRLLDLVHPVAMQAEAVEPKPVPRKTPASTAPAPVADTPAQELDFAQGDYTWVVASSSSKKEMETKAQQYRKRGLSCGVVEADVNGKKMYRVGAGRYDSWGGLTASRSALPSWVPEDTWPVRVEAQVDSSASAPTR